ncbi:MAG: hypothetical protein KGY76_04725 [Candidatus Thermoplasmatota archaeon]|nr:hypothetical protein [Candidatus Thermoplasmatota archaeon]
MRGKKTLIVGLCLILVVSGIASAPGLGKSTSDEGDEKSIVEKGISPICVDNGSQDDVDLYDNRVVWADSRNDEDDSFSQSKDIYTYDFETESERPLSTLSHNEYSPQIYEDTVIWLCSNASYEDQVMKKNLGGPTENISIIPGKSESDPQIGEKYAAWYFIKGSYPDTEYKLVLYRRSTGKAEVKNLSFGFPYDFEISDNRIAWVTFEGEDISESWRLHIYNASTGEFDKQMALSSSEICLEDNSLTYVDSSPTEGDTIKELNLVTWEERKLIDLDSPVNDLHRADDILVWADERNDEGDSIFANNTDIYIYDIDDQIEAQITSNKEKQEKPVISQDRIIWVDERNGNKDIYSYDLDSDVNSNGVVDYKEGEDESSSDSEGNANSFISWWIIPIPIIIAISVILLIVWKKRSSNKNEQKEKRSPPPPPPPN